MTYSWNILECIVDFLDKEYKLRSSKLLRSTQIASDQDHSSPECVETWAIGIHGDMMDLVKENKLQHKFKSVFRKFNMYTILMGTRYDKDVGNFLKNVEDSSSYYYQYSALNLSNIDFITDCLKMQKYKDSHFLFTEKLLTE